MPNRFTIQQDGDRFYLWANDVELTRPQITVSLEEALDILKVIGPIFLRSWQREAFERGNDQHRPPGTKVVAVPARDYFGPG